MGKKKMKPFPEQSGKKKRVRGKAHPLSAPANMHDTVLYLMDHGISDTPRSSRGGKGKLDECKRIWGIQFSPPPHPIYKEIYRNYTRSSPSSPSAVHAHFSLKSCKHGFSPPFTRAGLKSKILLRIGLLLIVVCLGQTQSGRLDLVSGNIDAVHMMYTGGEPLPHVSTTCE